MLWSNLRIDGNNETKEWYKAPSKFLKEDKYCEVICGLIRITNQSTDTVYTLEINAKR